MYSLLTSNVLSADAFEKYRIFRDIRHLFIARLTSEFFFYVVFIYPL